MVKNVFVCVLFLLFIFVKILSRLDSFRKTLCVVKQSIFF